MHADQLRLSIAPGEIKHLTAVGAIPGVLPLLAAARNGPGAGRIRSIDGGDTLQYQAPGSSTWGPAQEIIGDGECFLEDGSDADKWLRVWVYTAYLLEVPCESRVLLNDRYANGVTGGDLTAAEAALGDVALYEITLTNAGVVKIEHLVAWLDAAMVDLEISADGLAWGSPTNEAAGLALSDVAAGGSTTLYLRRTIGAGADSDPDVLDLVHFAFDGLD